MVALYNLAGSALFLAVYAGALLPQLYFGTRHKTWGFLVSMIFGLVLEITAYIARIKLHDGQDVFRQYVPRPGLVLSSYYRPNGCRNDQANRAPTLLGEGSYRYIVTITIGPAFFSAALYLSLARIIPVYGASNSRLQPRTYTVVFVFCDFVALVLQAAGGGLVAGSGPLDQATFDTGLSILRAGLAFHVAGMLAFVLLASDYARSVWKNKETTAKEVENDFLQLRGTRTFHLFVYGMASLFQKI